MLLYFLVSCLVCILFVLCFIMLQFSYGFCCLFSLIFVVFSVVCLLLLIKLFSLIFVPLFFDFFCFLLYLFCSFFFFFKQKTAYEMRISDWSSDVCSSD